MSHKRVLDTSGTSPDWQRHPTRLAVLPIGACEQHARHLPLDSDTLQAEYFARHLAQDLEAALLPAIPIGTSLEQAGFRGSLSLRPATLAAVVEDLARELESQGFTRLVIVNGHGGNFILNPTVRALNRENRRLRILLVNFWEHAGPELTPPGDIHAGEFETSVMLAIAPHRVSGERVDHVPPEEHPEVRQGDLTHFGIARFSPQGVWGRPSRASAEQGQRIVAAIQSNLLQFVQTRLVWLEEQGGRYQGLGPLEVRRMLPADVPDGLRFCRAAQWNQTAPDWALYLRQNPAGCSVIVQNGQVLGTVVTVDYQGHSGWIGMVLVDPAFRRFGLGTRLLQLAMDHLKDCETLKLDATPAGREVYLPLGFVDEYTLMRMEGVAHGGPYPQADRGVQPLAEAQWAQVRTLDHEAFGADRSAVLKAYWETYPAYARVCLDQGRVAGYCLGRKGFSFDQIGPVVAREAAIAEALVTDILRANPGRRFITDALLHSSPWVGWLKKAGFQDQRPFTRMYKGPNRHPGIPALQYAILAPEVG
ncbi:MAG: GNAT family N-acetyltransferase [Deltaproteobacteria bacterium]|nr:GNAT family N-acetyltransferase [Deltaproteobacteria bacterium]